ncbi:MAG: aspartate aminotransferase, partial [Zetaproteobacteria bacterium CG_4_9_14_3_um_filter_53_7]
PNSIAQKAALAALTGPTDELNEMVRTYEVRRNWLVDALNAIPGMHAIKPDGAFYVFPSVDGWIGKTTPSGISLDDDVKVCEWLLEEAGVALVPGTEFGSPGHIRFSYAVSQDTLEDAVNRIATVAATLV